YRDISKQKNIELNLRQKSSFMQALLKNIPDLVWLKDTEGLYMACNEQFERFFNANESEILGRSDFEFVSHELATFFQAHDKAAIAAGGSRINEEFLKFADGSYEGYFETVKTPMKDTEGNIIGVLGIARDISERKAQEAEIDKIQALARVGTWTWDIQKDEFKGSPESHRIFDIPMNDKITLKDILNKFAPDERERVKDQLLQVSQTQHKVGSIYCLNAIDEEERWIKTHTEFQYDANGKPIKALGIFQEVSEQVRYEKGLKEKDADLSEAQALAHIGSWRFDTKSEFLEWSDETYKIFGVEIGTPFTYENLLEHIHPDDVERVNFTWQAATRGEAYDIEHRIVVNGEIKWLHEHAKLKLDDAGNFSSAIGTVQEITQRKLYEQKLETLANYDSLTGLANRIRLVSDLQSATKVAKRSETQVALLMFDLDRFKDINDSYGHNAGDELLKQVAQRFSERLREGDLISRLGGDEFAVVLKDLAHPADAGRFAQKMIEVLSKNYELSRGISVHIGASAGIALFPENAEDADILLQYADAALYKSKAEGRGTYRYYTDELTLLARQRIDCETNLRTAIINQEFEVYYQPQVHITSGRIIGAEALVRWNHPLRGLVSPTEFIPVAEDTGLIGEIGEWVLNETCRQGRIWLNEGHRLTLAVNLSAHQIRYQDVVAIVEKALKKSGFEANRLELELTESVLMQREEETVEILHALRAKEIKLAIDDFGTGYSSLSYLKRFPIDILKIDKSFVDNIPYDTDDTAIVTAIIAMAKALGFQVLAEGVEQEEQLRFLQEKGCSMYQGYYKSKPLPAKEFEKLLK
ncbi:MAG: EAL domain-containing protein, partial [Sulfurimonas sp.]